MTDGDSIGPQKADFDLSEYKVNEQNPSVTSDKFEENKSE